MQFLLGLQLFWKQTFGNKWNSFSLQPDAVLVTQSTVSKYWKKIKALSYPKLWRKKNWPQKASCTATETGKKCVQEKTNKPIHWELHLFRWTARRNMTTVTPHMMSIIHNILSNIWHVKHCQIIKIMTTKPWQLVINLTILLPAIKETVSASSKPLNSSITIVTHCQWCTRLSSKRTKKHI